MPFEKLGPAPVAQRVQSVHTHTRFREPVPVASRLTILSAGSLPVSPFAESMFPIQRSSAESCADARSITLPPHSTS
jgi:hypothetical protein